MANYEAPKKAKGTPRVDDSGGWEGDGSIKDQNLQKVMEIVGVDSATGVNANDFTKHGLTREQIQELEFVRTDINRLMANVTMKKYDSEVEYLDDLGTLQTYFQKFVVGNGEAFTPGKYDKEMRDAAEKFKMVSKFWLSPDASGNIANPFAIMEKWAESLNNKAMQQIIRDREEGLTEEQRKELEIAKAGKVSKY
tara:strand:- start:357 stop:941 length:585 start_codon:yes stop_codon:yes gene_type:complete